MNLQRQLIGQWKSDRRRTLICYAPYHKQTELKKKRFISGLFGKLELKFTKKYSYSSCNGEEWEKTKYTIVDQSEDTLIIKIENDFKGVLSALNGIVFSVIQFEETRYHQYCSIYNSQWNYTEWFRKIKNT